MKRYLALFMGAIIFISCVCSGYGKPPVENSTSPAEEAVDEPVAETVDETVEGSTLSVYVVQNDALYADAVNGFQEQAQDITLNVTAFHSYDAMLDVMNEELLAGGGPDVVLYNSVQSEIDVYKLAKSGMFCPLRASWNSLTPRYTRRP